MTFHGLEEIFGEKERVLDTIEKTVRPLSASQLSFRPAPGVWSVAEIVEHLSIVEPGMLRLVRSLTEKAESAGGRGRATTAFEVTLDDRIRTRATCPWGSGAHSSARMKNGTWSRSVLCSHQQGFHVEPASKLEDGYNPSALVLTKQGQ